MAPSAALTSLGRPALLPQRLRRSRYSYGAVPREAARFIPSNATAPQRQPLPARAPSKLNFSVLFSDLDGTCVHYNSPIGIGRDGRPVEILQLPPSKTGAAKTRRQVRYCQPSSEALHSPPFYMPLHSGHFHSLCETLQVAMA